MGSNPTNQRARQFWDLYFQNKFVELQRTANEVKGRYLQELPPGRSYFAEPTFESFSIARAELKPYDYNEDGRFSEIRKTPTGLQDALQKIADGSYPFREPPPFGAKHLKELLHQLSQRFDWPSDASISSEQAVLNARSLITPFAPDNGQQLTALLWILGEQRKRAFSNLMVEVIEGAERLPSGHKGRMSSSLVNTAFEALWKINDKSCLERLLTTMGRSDHSGKLRIAALFKRLLSTEKLLSLETLGENYYSVEFWQRSIAPYANYSDRDWDRFDTKSLFWETRYLAASRLAPRDEALKSLEDDEVSLVREIARAKLQ